MKTNTRPDGSTLLTGDEETPFKSGVRLLLTQDEFDGVTAFLRELKPGIYIKCSECGRFKYGSSDIHIANLGVVCDGCAS